MAFLNPKASFRLYELILSQIDCCSQLFFSDVVGYRMFSNAQNVTVCGLRRSSSIAAPLVVLVALLLGSDFSVTDIY
jgi:hypothetical protein